MGILKNGIYGDGIGKIGNTTTYKLNGKTIVRLIGKLTAPPSQKQLINRMEMKVCVDFFKPLKVFINISFEIEATKAGMYPQNIAISYNKKNALMGSYPDISMDYEKVLLSSGDLPGLLKPTAKLVNNGIQFIWDDQTWLGWVRCNDQAMFLAYLPDVDYNGGNRNAFFSLSGARRIVGNDFLPIPANLLDQRMEVYILMISDSRKEVSDSQYLGRLNG